MFTEEVLESPVGNQKRQREILVEVLTNRSVKIKHLAQNLRVSEMTIRRDLDQLAETGQLERIHGGARQRQQTTEEESYFQRARNNAVAKDAIALCALELIREGETVGLDASTSALALARLLPAKKVRAVLTGLDAMETLVNTTIPFYMCGGQFQPKARSFVGGSSIETLRRFHPDKVFFSAGGFTCADGFTDPNPDEAEVKKALLRGGAVKVALLDSSKFGRRAFATTATIRDVDIVITDREPPEDIRAALNDEDVRIIVTGGRP